MSPPARTGWKWNRSNERGTRNTECGTKNEGPPMGAAGDDADPVVVPHSALRTPRSGKPVLGLIGGIAAALLAARGGRVINADALGHEALEHPEIKAELVRRWGERVLKPDGRPDRRTIAGIVFPDPVELRALEGLVFPYIGRRAVEE